VLSGFFYILSFENYFDLPIFKELIYYANIYENTVPKSINKCASLCKCHIIRYL